MADVRRLQQRKVQAGAAAFAGFVLIAVLGVWGVPWPIFLLPAGMIVVGFIVRVWALVRLGELGASDSAA